MLIPDVIQGLSGTTDVLSGRNKDVKKPHLMGPSTGEKEWAPNTIWERGTEAAMSRLQSLGRWMSAILPSTSCQDPP